MIKILDTYIFIILYKKGTELKQWHEYVEYENVIGGTSFQKLSTKDSWE